MAKKKNKKDYLNLPFEVYFGGPINYVEYELNSNKKPKKFSDIEYVTISEGQAVGVLFYCKENIEESLYCLIHDYYEVAPSQLDLISEESLEINYASHLKVEIKNNTINFLPLSDESLDETSDEYIDFFDLHTATIGFCAHSITDTDISWIVLDAENSRIRINTDGYEIDEEGNKIGRERIIEFDENMIRKYQQIPEYEIYDAKNSWIKSILEKDFPKEKKLVLSRKYS